MARPTLWCRVRWCLSVSRATVSLSANLRLAGARDPPTPRRMKGEPFLSSIVTVSLAHFIKNLDGFHRNISSGLLEAHLDKRKPFSTRGAKSGEGAAAAGQSLPDELHDARSGAGGGKSLRRCGLDRVLFSAPKLAPRVFVDPPKLSWRKFRFWRFRVACVVP